MELRKCYGPICKGILVDLSKFALNQKVCRECKRDYDRKRYEAKKPEIIAKVLKYKAKNQERIEAYNKAYQRKTPYTMPLENRIWLDLQRQARKVLKGYPYLFKSLEDLTGTSREDFFKHIQGQLSRGMNLGNYGFKGLKWIVQNNLQARAIDFGTREAQLSHFNFMNYGPAWFKSEKKKKIPFPSEKGISEEGFESAA